MRDVSSNGGWNQPEILRSYDDTTMARTAIRVYEHTLLNEFLKTHISKITSGFLIGIVKVCLI